MWYIVTFITGTMFGVCIMCMFQINKYNAQEEYHFDTEISQGDFDEKD